jgi:hypothetical protein
MVNWVAAWACSSKAYRSGFDSVAAMLRSTRGSFWAGGLARAARPGAVRTVRGTVVLLLC